MENILNHGWEWLLLIALISGAIYTMRTIRQESSSMLEESVPHSFHGVLLHIPRWWGLTQSDPHLLRFERTDTRYDWYAQFRWIDDGQTLTLPQVLERMVESEDLDFDKDDVVIETDSRVIFRHEEAQSLFREVVRVEGKASENIENRIYLDLCLIRPQGQTGYYLFESRSSVLNGMLEGPFFEEVLTELVGKKNPA